MSNSPERFVNETELKIVDKASKYIVFGYIQKIQQQLNNELFSVIPKLITCIILAFYFDDTDEFDQNYCGPHIKISNNNKTITHVKDNDNSNTCYGKTIIHSLSNGIYIWKIKIIKGDGSMIIGIDNAKATHCNKNLYMGRDRGCYAFYVRKGYIFSWQTILKSEGYPAFNKEHYGDTLIMKLHLGTNIAKLSYKWHDSEKNQEFIPFNDILREDGLSYRFAITLLTSDISAQLIS